MQDVLQGQRIASLSDNLPYHMVSIGRRECEMYNKGK